MPLDNQLRAQELLKFYYPIELSTDMDLETKIKYIIEWVDKAHHLILSSKISRHQFKLAASNCFHENNIQLRDGVWDMLLTLEICNIPCLIFSAGIADVVEEILLLGYQQKLNNLYTSFPLSNIITLSNTISNISHISLPSNLHVVSNRMIFSGMSLEDHVIGFDGICFHVHNKKASSIINTPFLQLPDIKQRTNILLLGDSLGDLDMSEGLSYDSDNIIKIGFLNDHIERLPEYLKGFDLVILGDPGLEIPLEIIQEIVLGK